MVKITTAMKKAKRPEKYTVKAARMAVYSVLYGKQEHTYLSRQDKAQLDIRKRVNQPEHDNSRKLSEFWEYNAAKATWDQFIGLCKFTPERIAYLEVRLEALRIAAKRRQPAE